MVKAPPAPILLSDRNYYQQQFCPSPQQKQEDDNADVNIAIVLPTASSYPSIYHPEKLQSEIHNSILQKNCTNTQMAAEPPGVTVPGSIINQSITSGSSSSSSSSSNSNNSNLSTVVPTTTAAATTSHTPPIIAVVTPTSRQPQQQVINNAGANKSTIQVHSQHHSATPSTSVPNQQTPQQQPHQSHRNISEIPFMHHHISTIPAAATTWPIVEPVFHFGPGFEPQPNYCPTHSPQQGGPQPSKHIVLFHVNPGVSVAFQLAEGNREIMRGPVTVPMVSQSGSPPIPMPVQVPPGHVMQQIVDESGALRHVILSTAQHQGGVQHHIHGHYLAPNGSTPHFFSPIPAGYPAPATHYHQLPNGHLQAQTMSHSPSPPNNNYNHKDERTQRQHNKLLRKLDKQRDINSTLSTPSPRKNELNGIRRNQQRNGASSVGTSEDGEESSSVPDEEDDIQLIIEQLSNVQSPQISEVTSRSALVKWTALQSANVGDNNNILNTRDLHYEVLLSDRGKEGKYKIIFKGQNLSCKIEDLRPGQEYYVCLQVHLEELQGSASEPAVFMTPGCEPDQPNHPKLITRKKNSLQLRWNAPADNGSNIINYILECDMGKNTNTNNTNNIDLSSFLEICTIKAKQYTVSDLQSSTWYYFRLAAVNELGKSEYSEIVRYSTAIDPPSQPKPPILNDATATTLNLAWERRPYDEEYVLQFLDNNQSNYGYRNMYAGRDNYYQCTNLRRATTFLFRLCASNEAGTSQWSDIVSFHTKPECPDRPSKPQLKGKIHATNFKVKWEAPHDCGGTDIKLYHLEISSGSQFERIYSGTELETICDRLQPGTTYQLRCICENVAGFSIYSDVCTVVTEPIAPAQPQQPYCANPPGPSAAVIRWGAPEYNGGAPILEYMLEVEDNNNKNSRNLVYKGKLAYCVVNNLLPGELYTVQVKALNRIGAGPWSDPFSFNAGAAAPQQPKSLEVLERSSFHICVKWDRPHCNGAEIIDYNLEISSLNCKNDDEDDEEEDDEIVDAEDDENVYDDDEYDDEDVRDDDDDDESNRSRTENENSDDEDYNAAAAEERAKVALQKKSAFRSKEKTKLSKQKPDQHSQSEKRNEPMNKLEATNFESIYHGHEESTEIKNLSPSTIYYFRLTARNAAGQSPYSDIVDHRTPPTTPDPPEFNMREMVITSSSIKALWLRSRSNGGAKVTHYNVEIFCGGNNQGNLFKTVNNRRAYLIENLLPDQLYKLRIQAVNKMGCGVFSNFVKVLTKPLPPKPPRLQLVQAGNNFLKLKWEESSGSTAGGPSSTLGSSTTSLSSQTPASASAISSSSGSGSSKTNLSIARYCIEMQNNRTKKFHVVYSGTRSSRKINKLDELTPYTFRICMESDSAGIGDYSEEYRFTTIATHPNSIRAPRIVTTASLATASPSAATSTATATIASTATDSNSIQLEWQSSKNNQFSDSIEYILHMGNKKDQEFKEVYRGPETRCTVSNLEFGVNYCFKVCPIRLQAQQSNPEQTPGIIYGSFSPLLNHQINNPHSSSLHRFAGDGSSVHTNVYNLNHNNHNAGSNNSRGGSDDGDIEHIHSLKNHNSFKSFMKIIVNQELFWVIVFFFISILIAILCNYVFN